MQFRVGNQVILESCRRTAGVPAVVFTVTEVIKGNVPGVNVSWMRSGEIVHETGNYPMHWFVRYKISNKQRMAERRKELCSK